MIYLSTEEVILLHEYQIETFGGASGLLNANLLESAVFRPQASFAGKDIYPTIFEKASALIISIIQNHTFVDGNKRTGLYAGLVFLKLNDIEVKIPNKGLVELAIKIAKKELDVTKLAEILEQSSHSRS